MKRVKSFVYNNCPELVVATIGLIIISIITLIEEDKALSLSLLTILGLTLGVHYYCIIKFNKNWRCFSCSFSFLRPGCVWINMDVKGKKKDENLKETFKEELKALVESGFIPKGTTCYCSTHDIVLGLIKEMCPDVKAEPLYKKNIAGYRKKLLPKEEHKNVKKDKRMFFAVKFVVN